MSENRHLVIHGWILCPAGSSPVYSDTMFLQSCADGTDCAGLFHREAEIVRSEERRVGKECRFRGASGQCRKSKRAIDGAVGSGQVWLLTAGERDEDVGSA